MSARVEALRGSVERLRALTGRFDDAALSGRAYPSEWTIAQVLSHIGSAAVIMQRRLEDNRSALTTPDTFAQGVWDEWNTKSPRSQADDALAADQRLLECIDSIPGSERSTMQFAMGPLALDFESFIGMRLNEHALHTWDIEVTLDPTTAVPGEAASQIVDNLELIARFTARPIGISRDVFILTTAPERNFNVVLADDRVTLTLGTREAEHDLELSAEAFARLVYGRLDPDHTPPYIGDPEVLDMLRRAFPGP